MCVCIHTLQNINILLDVSLSNTCFPPVRVRLLHRQGPTLFPPEGWWGRIGRRRPFIRGDQGQHKQRVTQKTFVTLEVHERLSQHTLKNIQVTKTSQRAWSCITFLDKWNNGVHLKTLSHNIAWKGKESEKKKAEFISTDTVKVRFWLDTVTHSEGVLPHSRWFKHWHKHWHAQPRRDVAYNSPIMRRKRLESDTLSDRHKSPLLGNIRRPLPDLWDDMGPKRRPNTKREPLSCRTVKEITLFTVFSTCPGVYVIFRICCESRNFVLAVDNTRTDNVKIHSEAAIGPKIECSCSGLTERSIFEL